MKPIAELLDLSGKTAIVTGGAKGIGRAIAFRLAEAGAQVLVADIDSHAAKVTAETVKSKGWKAGDYTVDVAVEHDVQRMVQYAKDVFGSIDILVNNAGVYPPQPIEYMSKQDFERVMDVNLRSVFYTTKYCSEIMKNQGGGKIINITSIDALHPSMIGLAHYDASKHGMWGFTKNSALEMAEHKIWVNAIAPGGILTPGVEAMQADMPQTTETTQAFLAKIPMKRMGDADEIGTVALFLASGMSGYMTGEQIVVDGGALLS